MYINADTGEILSHRGLQNELNKSFPSDSPPNGWYVYSPNPIEADSVPSAVSMRQARLALLQAGLLLAVEDEINLLDEPYRTQARIEWEYATHVERNSSLVGLLSSNLSMSVDDIDQLFITASTL